jgi:SSS family transporter
MAATPHIVLPHSDFGTVNYTVLIVYFIAMLAVGVWAGRSEKGAKEYFTGGGKIPAWLIGMSLLGTYLSSFTMMALPASSFRDNDFTWSIQLPFLLLTAVVITSFVLPRYRASGCLSVYEFLEKRIHISARMIAAVAFILLSIGRMGLVLYLPSLAFSVITGAPLIPTILIMGVVVIFYTVVGGMKGVIWTDAIQVVIFVAGAIATLFFVFAPGVDFWAVANASHKFRMLDWGTDITKPVTLWLILETIFQTIRIYATQQEMTQRYVSTESTREANTGVWISILGYIPLGYLFYFIGIALFVFYQVNPDPGVKILTDAKWLDALYPYFVVNHMPAGVAGLVIAAIFAAAMSTLSSSMNSCSAVCIEDFYKRFFAKNRNDEHHLLVAKWMSLGWGLLMVGMAILFMNIEEAQPVWSKIMAISTCGILGLMALAFLPWRVNKWSGLIGIIASYATLIALMFFLQAAPTWQLVYPIPKDSGVSFLLWPVITNLVCFFVALTIDRLWPRKKES